MSNDIDPHRIIDTYIKWRVENYEWTLVNRDETGATFSVPKSFGLFEHSMLWGGLIGFFIFWPITILMWIMMIWAYLSSGPSNYRINIANMKYELDHNRK